MAYKIIMHYSDGETEELDEVFASEKDADEYGMYMNSCTSLGAEILHMSNPGDYPDEDDESDYEIIEV